MQPRRLPLLVVAAGVAAVIGACEAFKTSDAPGASATDASATDAATIEDAAPIGPRFCETVRPAPDFCDDFDGDDLLGQRWDNGASVPDPGAQGGGTLAYDTSTFLSAPRGMVTTTGQLLAVDDSATGYLMKTLKVSPVVDVGFAFNVATESFDGDGASILAAIVFDDGGVLFVRDELGAKLTVVPIGKAVRFKDKVPLGAWSRVSLFAYNAPLDGGPHGLAMLTIDGKVVAETPIPSSFQNTKQVRILLGPNTNGPALPMRVYYDDVTIKYR
jgi:hypothetical protein